MKNERANSQFTEKLYETDGMLNEFEATVIGIHELCGENGQQFFGIELDRTAFFPEGGGQGGDRGYIGESVIFDTQTDEDGKILHYTKEVPGDCTEGSKVHCRLDFDLRFRRMQNHGAEHLLCGLIHNRFGYENSGFHMSDTGTCQVVFDADGPLSAAEIAEIELQANRVIYQNLPITIGFPDEATARELNYRSKLDTFCDIRLVTIEGIDVCACCAPQLNRTGQIGAVKIIDFMPHRGGMRMTMVAGINAYEDYLKLHEDNGAIMALLSSKREATAEFTKDFLGKFTSLKEENTSLKKEMVEVISASEISRILSSRSSDTGNTEDFFEFEGNRIDVIFTEHLDGTGLRNLINNCLKKCGGFIAGFCPKSEDSYTYIVGKSEDTDSDILPALAKELNEKYSGRGGGNSAMIQGTVEKSSQFLSDMVSYVISIPNA